MKNIITCLDGAKNYTKSICALSAWASKQLEAKITLLHVVPRHADRKSRGDLSGAIGLGAKSDLLNHLIKIDEQQSKILQEKGTSLLEGAKKNLLKQGATTVELLHLRGDFVETLNELDSTADLVVLGKRGECSQDNPSHLSANLENLARSLKRPLLIAPQKMLSIKQFAIAYDGRDCSKKALAFVLASHLLKGLKCHLLQVGEACHDSTLIEKIKLEKAGFEVTITSRTGQLTSQKISAFIEEQSVNLLAMGAYTHSKLHDFLLGSTTKSSILKTQIPLLLIH